MVPLLHKYLFQAMWFGYFAYWWAMSWDVKAAERREPLPSRLTRLILIVGAGLLIGLPRIPLRLLNERFLPPESWCFWTGAAITATGLLFSVWARLHLGDNWSQAVTVREGHELIQSGPYRLVRHPIYTGLLSAFAGSAIARGEWRGLLALGLIFVTLSNKLRLEEKWMREQFGDSYENYCRRVSALVPRIF